LLLDKSSLMLLILVPSDLKISTDINCFLNGEKLFPQEFFRKAMNSASTFTES
jgi:hypothetical protein